MAINTLIDSHFLLNILNLLKSCQLVIYTDIHEPGDLYEFYKICGGIDLYIDPDYGITIVSPKEFVLANPVTIGEKAEYVISSYWYIIGRDTNNNYLTIDLNKSRFSRCYDSNWDIHGVAGICPITANSFVELIERLIMNKGNHWY